MMNPKLKEYEKKELKPEGLEIDHIIKRGDQIFTTGAYLSMDKNGLVVDILEDDTFYNGKYLEEIDGIHFTTKRMEENNE